MNAKNSHTLAQAKNIKNSNTTRECLLCSHPFKMHSVFQRFCERCKHGNELYRMAEWMPECTVALDFASSY